MIRKKQIFYKHTAVLLLLSFAFIFYGIGDYSLKDPDEGRYAEIPLEMLKKGDFTVPYLNDVRYFEKPPFLYWVVALSYKIFGVSEWSFRFPNALAAALCVFALFFAMRRWFNEGAAFYSSLVLLSSFGFFAMARIVTTDMILTLWLFVALLCFFGYYRERRSLFLFGFYASMALATLTKGPVAPALLGITILLFLLTERNLAFLKHMKFIWGIPLYLAVAAPWFILISLREKEFFHFFFIDQHILRFITTKHKRGGPLYYFVPVILGGMFPWSFFIPRTVAAVWRNRDSRLFLIWSAVVFLFFSASGSKLPPYILPVFPAVALTIGLFFHERRHSNFNVAPETIMLAATFAVFAFSWFLYLNNDFMDYIRNISTDASAVAKDLMPFSIWISLIAAICSVLLLLKKFRHTKLIFTLLFLFSLAVNIAIIANNDVIDRLKTTKYLAKLILQEKPDLVVNYSSFDHTLPFYLGTPVIIASYKGELAMGSKYEDAAKIFIDEEKFFNLLLLDKRILFITKEKHGERLERHFPGRIHMRMCHNDRCLYANY
jgi:4-amino-4-deoxy-L-arabinose transferase-like glycosyltransferase